MKENLKTYKWILSQAKSFIPALVAISIIKIVASYLSVKYSLVMRDVIDAAIGGTGDEFKDAIIVMMIFVTVMLVFKLVNRNLTQVTGFKMNRMWKKQMTKVIMEADYQKVSKYHSGNLLSRMTADVRAVDAGLISFVPGVLALLTKLITAIVVMGTLASDLTIVICIGGIVVVLASTVFRKRLKELHKLVQEANAKVTSFIQETLERLHMVQALDVADEIEKREDDLLEQRYRIQLRRKNLGLVASGGLSIICIVAELGILLWSVVQLRSGYITFGTLTAMVTLFAKLEAPFVSMSAVLPQYVAMMGSADRIREIYDLPGQSDAGHSDSAQSESAQSESVQSESVQSATTQRDNAQSNTRQSENVKCDTRLNGTTQKAIKHNTDIDCEKLYRDMTSLSGKDVWFKYDNAISKAGVGKGHATENVTSSTASENENGEKTSNPQDEYVIRGLSFDIPKGAFCAVTGSSGIGKSTLMKLLLGMCAPSSGKLECVIDESQGDAGKADRTGDNKHRGSKALDANNNKEDSSDLVGVKATKANGVGSDTVTLSRATRSLFAYVPQGNMLLSGTLKENLLLTKPDANDNEIADAIHVADMEGFVNELPDGLDTMIGENALGISEGQAQRVSIARAVLCGKPIILLDEATSALDAATEKRVLERIRALEGKTVIAVTHRSAAKEMSDCIIEM